MKRFIKFGILLFAILLVENGFGGYIKVSSGAVVPGQWNSNFEACEKYAREHFVPLIVYSGSPTCDNCLTLQQALVTPTFENWAQDKKPILCFTEGQVLARKFAKPEDSNALPYIGVAWWKENGTESKITFSGRWKLMPAYYEGIPLDSFDDLAQEFIDSCGLVMASYPYAGAEFTVPVDNEGWRMELEEGYTQETVKVPLSRTVVGMASKNALVCGSATNVVEWLDEGFQEVEVSIPAGIPAGGTIPLELLDENGVLHATNFVFVTTRPVSVSNPVWVGERTEQTFRFGEWTMDWALATNVVAKTEGARVLALFSGVLWCPYCDGMEHSLLADEAFTTWASSNKVALVLFDQPLSGEPAPRLLSWDGAVEHITNTKKVGGAYYLMRKGLSVDDESVSSYIAHVFEKTQSWRLPEATASRIGNPTLILLGSDFKPAGRLSTFRTTEKVYETSENLRRLDDLLLIPDDNEKDGYCSTSSRSLAVGTADHPTICFQVNDRLEVFALNSVPVGEVDMSLTNVPEGRDVSMALVRVADDSKTVLATGTTSLSYVFSKDEVGSFFLELQAYPDLRTGQRLLFEGTSIFDANLRANLVLIPEETCNAYVPSSEQLSVLVEAGCDYRLIGFGGEELERAFDVVDGARGIYRARESGKVPFTVSVGSEVEYQIWNPGEVSFAVAKQGMLEYGLTGVVTVVRSEHVSGRCAVTVVIDPVQSTAENGTRFAFANTDLVWEDGETGAKTVEFPLFPTSGLEGDQTIDFKLQTREDSDSQLGDISEHIFTISDTDLPVLALKEYPDVVLHTTINAAEFSAPVFNVTNPKKLGIKVVSGKLPKGVSLVYDSEKECLTFKGQPTKKGTYSFSVVLSQDGNSGPKANFTVDVCTAESLNGFLGKKTVLSIPLVDDENTMIGRLDFSSTSKNKLTVKHVNEAGVKTNFAGNWNSEDSEGRVATVLKAKTGDLLDLSLSADGRIEVVLLNAEEEVQARGSGQIVSTSILGACAGTYSLVFNPVSPSDSCGAAMGTLVISSKGVCKCAGVLPTGVSLSGSAYLSEQDGFGIVPIQLYKRGKGGLMAVLKIRPHESPDDLRAVVGLPEIHGSLRWNVGPCVMDSLIDARGSFIAKTLKIGDFIMDEYGTHALKLSADAASFVASAIHGNIVGVPSCGAVAEGKKISLDEKRSGFKLSYNSGKQTISGTVPLEFEDGKVLVAKFKGAVVPGWLDCNCEEYPPEDLFKPISKHPLAVGTCWFNDSVEISGEGAIATGLRSVPIRLTLPLFED